MSAPMPTAIAARRRGVGLKSFVAFVATSPASPEVRVRFRDVALGWRWACQTCGKSREIVCPHMRAAHKFTVPAIAAATTTEHDN